MSPSTASAPFTASPDAARVRPGRRSEALAARLERGAGALATFAATLTDEEWQMPLPGDGRTVGVVVHHVASMYPIEVQFAETVAAGTPVRGLTWEAIHRINAEHATEHAGVTAQEAIDALRRNSAAAAAAIRSLTDEQLDRAVTISLYADAPLTCQFALEDHAVRHAYHHLARIRAALAPGISGFSGSVGAALGAPGNRAQHPSEDRGVHRKQRVPVDQPG